MNKTFIFKLVDLVPYKNDNGCRLVLYSTFGFFTTIFCNERQYRLLIKAQENKDFNINDYIRLYYDNDTQNFVYFINIK